MAVRLKSWPHELRTAKLNRRVFARKLGEMSLATLTICHTDAVAAAEPNPSQTSTALRDRVRGLLLGSMIGDAAGGPVEFKHVSEVRKWLPDARSWPESKKLNDEEIHELSSSLPLLPYKDIRPEPAPYGPWAEDGPPGTITDDSRHKMVLIRALRGLREAGDQQLTVKGLAQSYLDLVLRNVSSTIPLTVNSMKNRFTSTIWQPVGSWASADPNFHGRRRDCGAESLPYRDRCACHHLPLCFPAIPNKHTARRTRSALSIWARVRT